jgi:hypothetical protein
MSVVRHGVISYLDDAARERGREHFSLYKDRDNNRTLQVTCEIDATGLVRHVVQTVDAAFRPVDVYVRIAKAQRYTASGWFHFTDRAVRISALSDDHGLLERHLPLSCAARAFGTHPLAVDGWMAALFDYAGPSHQMLTDAYVSSYAFDGSGVVDCLPLSFGLEYLGVETAEVRCGSFRCHHFRYLLEGSAVQHPPYETWVTADGEFMMVRANVGVPLNYRYELTEIGPPLALSGSGGGDERR